jgi:metallo-beta-lactamase family protein
MIKLGFYGAAGEVTGSCYILTTDRARVMIDMGMHQGEQVADEHNHRMPPDPARLDAVVLTHAHLDHCGRLPLLAKAGYRGRIHCTMPTAELTDIILKDSAHIQVADTDRFNTSVRGPDDPPQQPLYDLSDVERTLPLLTPTQYNQPVKVAQGITVQFIDSGHILGAASILMTINDGPRTFNLVFSGDVGIVGSPILRDPVTPLPADAVLLESTYGDRDHKPLDATRDELLSILKEAQASQAKVLIPAFAIGRTQDLIFHIGEFLRAGQLQPIRVFIDSPMAVAASELYIRHPEVYDAHATELRANHISALNFPGLTYIKTVDESKALNTDKGCMVIIAASGMCTGGRIVHHLLHHITDPTTRIVIVGYQGDGTLGRQLVDGARQVKIFRETLPVRAQVHTLGGFSAHAGQSGLLAWAAPLAPAKPRLFLTHGEDGPRQVLRDKLKQQYQWDSTLPRYGDEVTLS